MNERDKMILEKEMEIWHDTFMKEPHREYVYTGFCKRGYYKDTTDIAKSKADKAVKSFREAMGFGK